MTRVLHCLPLLLLAALSLPASAASTSNLAREKSYADQIEKYLVVGDAIRLEARGVKFMAIDTKPENPPVKGAVILLHGRGVHPAWGFFDKLRMDIAENKGWRTLSIQLPILDTDTALDQYGPTLPEAFERIDAAIAHLRKSGVKKIVLLGHSSGAVTAAYYLAGRPVNTAQGVLLIGLGPGFPPYESIVPFASLRLPTLDVSGGKDFPYVLEQLPTRERAAAKAGNRQYRQVQIPGANHFYAEHYGPLRARVFEWLDSLK